MEKDELQILIDEAKKNLSRESKEAIDNSNWKLTILEIGKKYSPVQVETLEMETELLLAGILNPGEYENELGDRMGISRGEVSILITEMDKLIFKKIEGELIKTLRKQEIKVPEERGGEINNEELIIKNGGESSNEVDEIPLPPYVISRKEEVANSEVGEEESSKEKISSTQNVVSSMGGKDEEFKYIPKNVFEDKMNSPTISEHVVSNQSNPKVDPYRETF